MAVYVGAACIDENGKARGGKAGDQTKKEVKKYTWSKDSRGWRVFRAKDAAKAEKLAAAMEAAIANNNIGYDQGQRSTLYTCAKAVGFDIKRVYTPCETDCSALVRVCCASAGIMLVDFNTSSEPGVLLNSGAFEELKGTAYTNSSAKLKRGDILCTAKKGHTEIVLSDGPNAGASTTTTTATTKPAATATSSGKASTATYTLKQFIKDVQAATGAKADGVAGPETLSKTVTVSEKINRKHKVVKPIQKYLYALGFKEVGTADGIAGPKFTKAVKAYQKKYCKVADGEITAGKTTWKKLLGMA